MDVSHWFARETWQLDKLKWATIAAFSVAISFIITTSWAAPAATLMLLLFPTILLWLGGYSLRSYEPTKIDVWLLVLIAYVTVSALWAVDLYWSGKAIWPVYGAFAALQFAILIFHSMPERWLGHACRSIFVTYCVLLLFMLFEETTDHAFKRIVFWPFQAISLKNGEISVNWQHISFVRGSRTNWNMTTLIFLVWPMFIILRSQVDRSLFRAARILLIVLTATVLQSHHQAAIVALIIGVLTFGLARISVKLTAVVLAVFWILSFVAAVPIAQLAYDQGLQTEKSLPASFRHRVVLWKYTADQISQRPVFGVGIGSSHPLNAAHKSTAQKAPGTDFLLETGTHPHNIYLQVIYELGIVGALFVIVFGLVFLRSICALDEGMNGSYFLAAFAAWATQSAFSFAMTEAWYVFALMFAVCVSIAGQRLWILGRSKTADHPFTA